VCLHCTTQQSIHAKFLRFVKWPYTTNPHRVSTASVSSFCCASINPYFIIILGFTFISVVACRCHGFDRHHLGPTNHHVPHKSCRHLPVRLYLPGLPLPIDLPTGLQPTAPLNTSPATDFYSPSKCNQTIHTVLLTLLHIILNFQRLESTAVVRQTIRLLKNYVIFCSSGNLLSFASIHTRYYLTIVIIYCKI
jgi:hypothetical protein